MAKVKMFRYTGYPVRLEDLEAHKEEFTKSFDKIVAKHSKDMERVQKVCTRVESILARKYPCVIDVEMPSTLKAWKSLTDTYGNVQVSRHRDTGEVLLIIRDEPDYQY